jgi:hypothetical protein
MSLEHEIKKGKETYLSSIVQGAVSAMQRKCVLGLKRQVTGMFKFAD